MKQILIFLVLCLSLSGCSALKRSNTVKKFTVKKMWVRHTLAEHFLGFRHPNRMTPVVTKDTVVQGNSLDAIVAFERKSGHVRWRLPLKGGVEGGAALAGNNLVFGSSDGQFYSVDIQTGLVNWSFPIRSEGLGAPSIDKGVVYFLAGNNILYALDLKTGSQKWLYNRRDSSMISIRGGSQPTISGTRIYVGFSDGYLVALDKRSGNVAWEKSLNRNKRFKDIDASPVIEGKRLYVSSYDGKLHCLDRVDGRTLWESDLGGSTPVTLVGKRLYYATSLGQVVALDKQSGKELWRREVKEGVATQPQEFRGLIAYGESAGDFTVVDARTGKKVGSYSTGRGIMSSPSIDKKTGESYFISVNAHLYALKLTWVSPQEVWPWEK